MEEEGNRKHVIRSEYLYASAIFRLFLCGSGIVSHVVPSFVVGAANENGVEVEGGTSNEY